MSDVPPSPTVLTPGTALASHLRQVAASTGDREGDGATMLQPRAILSSVKPWETSPIPAGWQRGDGSRQRWSVLWLVTGFWVDCASW